MKSKKSKKYLLASGLFFTLLLLASLTVTLVGATTQILAPIKLNPGSSVAASCNGGKLTISDVTNTSVLINCVTVSVPATATPTASMPDMVGVCGESQMLWHPPVIVKPNTTLCDTGHEHGDPPPDWIKAAGYSLDFMGHFNTSPLEDTLKHAAMKGFSARFGNVDVYFRVHAASNPLDRSARYHSYEVWARDPSLAVSHWQGWYNTGDPNKDRIPRRLGVETSVRPVMLVVDQTSWNQGIRCEQWYANTANWSWDFGWTICNATTLYKPGENATAKDQTTWTLAPDGSLGGTRRLEAAWYSNRSHPTGHFYTTQFGEIVTGPKDAKCSATTTSFGETYQNVCLEQYIAPTMQQVAFPGNSLQKTFNTTGVKIPN